MSESSKDIKHISCFLSVNELLSDFFIVTQTRLDMVVVVETLISNFY